MLLDNKTQDYKTHKYKRNVYVEINPKTKVGQDLLHQYHNQTNRQYVDVGRIGYHDEDGRYKIDYYTLKELKIVPKLIISVLKSAVNRAGKDIYKLRTYMSKFGQLNFLLTVDNNYSELILVENVYISNLNYREDYETVIWRINHCNEKPVPLREIFYEYGIKANPDDYGKSWNEDIKINNIIVAKAKAGLAKKIANELASSINQKALVASLNYLNVTKEYGKKITSAYSQKVAKEEEINKLASSPKLENTLNQILIKTIEEKTDKKDLKNKENLETYKSVVKVQFFTCQEIRNNVEKELTKQNLKNYMLQFYEKSQSKKLPQEEKENFDLEQNKFKKFLNVNFDRSAKEEKSDLIEEKFNKEKYKNKVLPNEYRDFENKKLDVNLNTDRFLVKETSKEKSTRQRQEKQNKKLKKERKNLLKKQSKRLKCVYINCNLDDELEKSKVKIGVNSQGRERIKNKKELKIEKKQEKKLFKKIAKKQQKKESILTKIENKIKKHNLKLAEQKETRERKKQKLIESKIKKEKKKKKKQELDNQFFDDKNKKKLDKKEQLQLHQNNKNENEAFRPIVKEPEQKQNSSAEQKNTNTQKNNFLLMSEAKINNTTEAKKEANAHNLNKEETHAQIINNYIQKASKNKKEKSPEM